MLACSDACRARLTGLGPNFRTPKPGVFLPDASVGQATVDVLGEKGTVMLKAREFIGSNEQGKPVALDGSPSSVTLTPGQHAVLHLSGTFTAGNGALSFIVAGVPMVTWDFSVELD